MNTSKKIKPTSLNKTSRYKKQYSSYVRKSTISKIIWMVAFSLITGFAIYTLTKLVKEQQSLRTRATVGAAEVKVFPTTTSMPPDNLFKIMVNSSKTVGFANVELTFDKDAISLVQINPGSVLSRVVKQSSVTEANSTGKITLTYALDPSNRSNPPSGNFVLGEIKMAPLAPNLNSSTIIAVDQSSLQIVDMEAMAFTTSSIGAKIMPSTSPTASPESSATPSPVTPTPSPGTISASTLSFVASDDATIDSAAPHSNYGKKTVVEVDHSADKNILMKFTVSGIGTKQVKSAKIRLFNVNSSKLGGIFYVAAHSNWSESTVNWNTAPATQGSPIATLGQVRISRWVEVDVTSTILKDGTYSFRINSNNSDGADYSSRETSRKPQLIITVQ